MGKTTLFLHAVISAFYLYSNTFKTSVLGFLKCTFVFLWKNVQEKIFY